MDRTLRAVVTGGSAGIGAAISNHLLDQGYSVVVLDRNPPGFSREGLSFHQVDLMDGAATRAVAARLAAGQAVTHLIHNAGIIRPNPIEAVPDSDLTDLAQLHFGAALILLQAVLPAMRADRFGRVVLISSRAALGASTRTAYAATKAGLIGMGRTWALELAADGITVNMVAPGPIRATEMFHEIVPAGSARERSLAQAIPVGRLGETADVAHAVGFFASPASGFVTGQTLYVCGGASVGTLTI